MASVIIVTAIDHREYILLFGLLKRYLASNRKSTFFFHYPLALLAFLHFWQHPFSVRFLITLLGIFDTLAFLQRAKVQGVQGVWNGHINGYTAAFSALSRIVKMREMRKTQMIFLFISFHDMVQFAAIYRHPD